MEMDAGNEQVLPRRFLHRGPDRTGPHVIDQGLDDVAPCGEASILTAEFIGVWHNDLSVDALDPRIAKQTGAIVESLCEQTQRGAPHNITEAISRGASIG